MKKNIDTYQFKGDWEFNLRLPKFSKIYSDYWFKYSSKYEDELLEILENGYVPFKIFDERTYDPEPTESQNNSIKYLIENESLVVESILKNFKNDINELYAEGCGQYNWIPQLNTYKDLGKLLRINSIEILSENYDGISYTKIAFEYLGDEEHGIAIILHKDRLIDFSGIGDINYECIYKELGLDEKKVFEEILKQREIGKNIVHKPLGKYKKFKPWQLDSTSDYFEKLLREKNNKKLIEEIEANQWDINIRFSFYSRNLVDKAAYSNNIEILKYLIEKDGDYARSIFQCTGNRFNPESLKFLVNLGASIDTPHYYGGKTPLHYVLKEYTQAIYRKEKFNKNDSRYLRALEEYETCKKKIQLYMELGANPNQLDKEGTTYKNIKLSWAEHIIQKYKIREKVEELINPKSTSIVSSNGGSEVSKTITEPDIDSVTVTNSFGSTAENSIEITQGYEEAEEGQEAIAPAIAVVLRLFAKGGEGALTNVLVQWISEYANPEHDYMSIADAWDGLKIDFTKVPVAVAISTFSDGGTGQRFNDVIDLLYKKLDPDNDHIDISKIDIFSEGLITDSFFKEADVWLNGGGTKDITFPNQPNLDNFDGPIKEILLCMNLSEKYMNELNDNVRTGGSSRLFHYFNRSKSRFVGKIETWIFLFDLEEPC